MTPPPRAVDLTPELLYLLAGDPAELAETVAGLRSADIAELLRELPPESAAVVLAALPFDLMVQVFDEPELEHRYDTVQRMDDTTARELIREMSSDQQAELFREVPDAERQRFMRLIDEPTRQTLTMILKYPPESAGGIMTTEFVSVPATWTVQETLEHITAVGRAKETVYAVYVHDPESLGMVHVVSLRDLMTADRSAVVTAVGDRRKPLTVNPLADREEVARTIAKYDLLALPVVDDNSRVIGIVTVDDVIDAILAEHTEDVHKFGGMAALEEPYIDAPIARMVQKRAGWLIALFVGQMLTATAMGYFEDELAAALVLALFVPLIISSGGNSGAQATSLIIRAMALREVQLRDWWRVAARELPAGLILGGILGVLGTVRIILWGYAGWADYGEHYVLVGITVGLALLGVVTFGSLSGSMLPFVLRRFGFDPASASAPFVATLVDVTGIVMYFSVAALILRGTLL
jgi:magnesium transporter